MTEAAALEVELVVVQGVAQFDEGGVGVVVGITLRETLADVAQGPPLAFALLGLAEGLADHLHQVVHALIRLVFLDEHLDLIVFQPVALTVIKEVKSLGEELLMIEVVIEIDVARHADAGETPRTRGIDEGLLLVGGADERGIAAILLDGLAVRRTELDIG